MGLDFGIIPVLISGTLAILFVVLEQWKGERPWQSWRLWLALICLIATIIAIVVESYSTKALEKEHRADLLLIQKQNAALNSLCFELHLQPYDVKYDKGCSFQVQTYSEVEARISRTGLIAEYFHFQFHPDTGWYRSSQYVMAWPTIKLLADSINNTVKFELSPFGIKAFSEDILVWKVERLTDLAQVRFGIQMMYSADPIKPRNPPIYTDVEPPNLDWSPVESIYLYANSYEPENLITKLVPKERSYGDSHSTIYFHPEKQVVKEPDWFGFYIDLLHMREYILNSIDS